MDWITEVLNKFMHGYHTFVYTPILADSFLGFLVCTLERKSLDFNFLLQSSFHAQDTFCPIPFFSFPLACALYRSFLAFRYIGHFGELCFFPSPWWALGF